jgi:hypothetical protein
MSNKYLYLVLKAIFSLLILLPVVSFVAILLGQDISPKPEYYNTEVAYSFIKILMDTKYIVLTNSLIFAVSLVLLWTKRAALAAVLVLPVTYNIIAFHAFLDGGLLTGGAVMGDILFAINLYLIWYHRDQYLQLISKK